MSGSAVTIDRAKKARYRPGVRALEEQVDREAAHRLMVLDERVVIARSFYYTAPATTLNDENLIVLGDLEETDPTPRRPSESSLTTR